MPAVTLTKHHALGNDFLVVFTDQVLPRLAWGALAQLWCARRAGIGADGLVVATVNDGEAAGPEQTDAGPAVGGPDPEQTDARPAVPLRMTLFNADGSEAEMSGNGIRCLVQAWARRVGRGEGDVVVATVAGLRAVRFGPGPDSRSMVAAVDMGAVTEVGPPASWSAIPTGAARPVIHVAVGNPHTVVAVDSVDDVDLVAIGAQLADVNLEIVAAGPEPDAITMRVHERGVGVTEACGTGASAAAWSALAWGMVPAATTEITVHMDGGDAKVRVGQPSPGRVTLAGPATFIATIEAEC